MNANNQRRIVMNWFLYLMGSLWLIIGILIVLYTNSAIELINGLMEKGNWRVLGLLPFSIGILLTISAWWSKFFWTILVLGLLAVLKGIFYLFAPLAQIEKFMTYWRNQTSEVVYRLWGLIAVLLGIFVLVAA